MDPTLVEHVRGDALATVTVLEYGDYECPYCAAAAPVLRDLVDQSEGRIRLVFRNFPLFEVHPHALVAALAAESTTASGHFWEMHYLLFEQQARLTDFDLRKYALHVGSDPDLATGEAAQRSRQRSRPTTPPGIECGVAGTPTLFIDGAPYLGRVELGALQRATGTSSPHGRRPWQRG